MIKVLRLFGKITGLKQQWVLVMNRRKRTSISQNIYKASLAAAAQNGPKAIKSLNKIALSQCSPEECAQITLIQAVLSYNQYNVEEARALLLQLAEKV